MDRNGPDWCEANAEYIVDQMAANASQAKAAFSRTIAAMMVAQAIAEARELIAALEWHSEK